MVLYPVSWLVRLAGGALFSHERACRFPYAVTVLCVWRCWQSAIFMPVCHWLSSMYPDTRCSLCIRIPDVGCDIRIPDVGYVSG